jgi:predicted RNase H-related nuclease YkuK (DUF458 family)
MAWKTYSGKIIEEPIEKAVEQVIEHFKTEKQKIKICIGTDSSVKTSHIDMVTVIVFYVIGNGGFMYVKKQKLQTKMSMRERMMAEVSASIETAYQIHPVIEKNGVEMEIHADINQDARFQSNQALSDAMGYTKGMGYVFVSKPDAFASSVCADRLCQ